MAVAEDKATASHGRWKGSTVNAGEIQTLVQARKMPEGVLWREPDRETVPDPRAGERIVFVMHFERGFDLPIINFFQDFLDFHRLQPHHLTTNFVIIMSGFVTLCEGYLGCGPSIGLWKRLFNL